MDSSTVVAGVPTVDVYKKCIIARVNIALNISELDAWSSVQIGTIENWCGEDVYGVVYDIGGDNTKSLVIKINQDGSVHAETQGKVTGLNKVWLYGVLYQPIN